jgi:hypothetical protein
VETLLARTEVLALVLTLASGVAAWGIGIRMLGYDYDEVMRAHSMWLAAQDLCPYRDFLDCHPPYFAMFTPVFRIYTDDPCAALSVLRILSALGNLLFLGGLAALGVSIAASGRRWVVLGLAVVAFHPAILEFLVEFRVDGWGYALAVWSIYRFRRLPRGLYREFELGVLTGIASLLFCPKLAMLPPLVMLFAQLARWESVRSFVRAGIAYVAGALAAAGQFALYLTWLGIDFDRAFQILVRYNAISNSNLAIHYGLLQSIVSGGALSWMILGGAISWAVYYVRHKTYPDPYELALAAWLMMQALLVAYQYKQYYAPWFLFASGFLVYLFRVLSDLLGRARVVIFVTACTVTATADFRAAQRWSDLGDVHTQERLIRWMNRVTRPEDRVVASPPFHPIDRYDTFFVWFNTLDWRGFDAERILAQLPLYQEHVAAGRFRAELEAHPPALVVLSRDWRVVPYTSGQGEALSEFLPRHGYVKVKVGTVWFALRPDRFEQARREGLLEVASN